MTANLPGNLSVDPSVFLWSLEEEERPAALAERPLLLLLHGRGSHEQDLFALAPLLSPHYVIAALRAPIELAPGSYSWFPAADPGLPSALAADAAVVAVLDWLDGLVSTQPVSVIGFSQGGAMALHLMRHAPRRFAALVNLAGFVIAGEQEADAQLENLRPPVFWGRDVRDPVIPHSAIERTTAWLPSHSTLTERLYEGVGHSISREEIADVSEFLASA